MLTGLLGLNGAGKTTLFGLLTRLLHSSVLGHSLANQLGKALAQTGVVFQQSTLDIDLTVRQNLQYHAALHGIVVRHESLEWGVFRDRPVTIAGTEWIPLTAETLDAHFSQLLKTLQAISDIYIRAMTGFLDIARNQYFFDGNKRTGRLLMNGVLLDAGYDVISVPYKRQQAFNEKMLRFYGTGESEEMFAFLLSCSTVPGEKPQLAK